MMNRELISARIGELCSIYNAEKNIQMVINCLKIADDIRVDGSKTLVGIL